MGYGSGGVSGMPVPVVSSQSGNTLPTSAGLRGDGTQKGTGYFGKLPMQDGSGMDMTEFGISVNMGGEEVEMPTVVPTLSKSELEHLLKGGDVTPEIENKAVEHALKRMKEGKSTFWQEGEQVYGVPKE